MKLKALFVSFLLINFFSSCKKDSVPEDPHNQTLLGKNLDQIRHEIAGKAQVRRELSNGVAGPIGTDIPSGKGDLYQFLFNDTVKITDFTSQNVFIHERAKVSKKIAPGYTTAQFMYELSDPSRHFVMQEIKRDSLIIDAGFTSGGGWEYSLVRTP